MGNNKHHECYIWQVKYLMLDFFVIFDNTKNNIANVKQETKMPVGERFTVVLREKNNYGFHKIRDQVLRLEEVT